MYKTGCKCITVYKTFMAMVHPHVNFNGNAEEAFGFYKSVFGGELTDIIRFKDIAGPEFQVSEEEKEKLMNIALFNGSIILAGNDVPSFMGKTNERENRSKIVVTPLSREEADALFNGLSAGGEVEFPMGDGPSGSYFGSFRDKYGIEWMIDFKQNA
jgi:PhnB protein